MLRRASMSKHSQTRFVTVNCKFQKSKVDFEENKLEMQNKEQRLAYAFRGAAALAMEFSPFIFDSTFLRYEAEMCSVPSHHHSLTQAFFALTQKGKEGFICTFLAHLLKYVGRKSGKESRVCLTFIDC